MEIIDVNLLKVGDKIELKDADSIVKDFLKERMFLSLEIKHLRVFCLLKDNTKYVITNVCKSRKMVKIKVGKFWLDIRYSQIKTYLI